MSLKLHKGGQYARREYDIRILKAVGENANGQIVFMFEDGDLTNAESEVYYCSYSGQLAAMLNEHPTEEEVTVV